MLEYTSYFIGRTDEAFDMANEAQKRYAERESARRKLVNEYNEDGLLVNIGFLGAETIVGLLFKDKVDYKFLKGEKKLESGYSYTPKKTTKEGRKLFNRFSEDELYFSMRGYILSKTGLTRYVCDEGDMYTSAAGVIEGIPFVVIPGQPGDGYEKENVSIQSYAHGDKEKASCGEQPKTGFASQPRG